jgi:histidine triad (HIT) family protein
VDDALRAEGSAREIVSRIQGLRKERDLDYTARIEVALAGDPEVLAACKAQSDAIARETLATRLWLGDDAPPPTDAANHDDARSGKGGPRVTEHTETIFDKILRGDVPCHRVYEDEHVLAFLDIFPLAPGHTLIIPKERKAFLHELSEESAAAIGRVLPRIARAVVEATGATAYNVLQNNGRPAHQAIFHVHFHVIPRLGEQGLGIGWKAGKLGDAEARSLVDAMRAALG